VRRPPRLDPPRPLVRRGQHAPGAYRPPRRRRLHARALVPPAHRPPGRYRRPRALAPAAPPRRRGRTPADRRLQTLPTDAPALLRALAIQGAAFAVYTTLLAHAEPAVEDPTAGLARFAGLCSWLEDHLHEPLTVADLAAQAHLSPAQFHAVFKDATGRTPMAWLQDLRLERAARELLAEDDAIAAVAERCGFRNPFHFSRAFKGWTGRSPRAWRVAHRDLTV